MKLFKRFFSVVVLAAGVSVAQLPSDVSAGFGAANGSVAERAAGAISAGSGFNCWVESGAAKCIGGNGSGQLGDGT